MAGNKPKMLRISANGRVLYAGRMDRIARWFLDGAGQGGVDHLNERRMKTI